MQWNLLPGTTVEADLSQPHAAEKVLHPLFLPGGLMLSQVARLTGLEPYVIQNWVKRGFVSPPERKKYSRRQFCRILVINMLKDALQLEKICKVLSYVNGDLDRPCGLRRALPRRPGAGAGGAGHHPDGLPGRPPAPAGGGADRPIGAHDCLR